MLNFVAWLMKVLQSVQMTCPFPCLLPMALAMQLLPHIMIQKSNEILLATRDGGAPWCSVCMLSWCY
jgi:hypothetical protein